MIAFQRLGEYEGMYEFSEPTTSSVAMRCHLAFKQAGAPFNRTNRTWVVNADQAAQALGLLSNARDRAKQHVETAYGDVIVTPTRKGSVWVLHVKPQSHLTSFEKRVIEYGGTPAAKGWFLSPEAWTEIATETSSRIQSSDDGHPHGFRKNQKGLMIAVHEDGRVDRNWHRHPTRCQFVQMEGHEYDLFTIKDVLVARQRHPGGHDLLRAYFGYLPWQDGIDGCELTLDQAAVFNGAIIPEKARAITRAREFLYACHAPPAIGTSAEIGGRKAEVIRLIDPYIRKTDGLVSFLIVWASTCVQCGSTAEIITGRSPKSFRPLCNAHARPGK
jgi:hypothetical protein